MARVEPKEVPQHVAEELWKTWPRKGEAHLLYGARERQVTAACRTGRLTVYLCPDDTKRLDPEQLAEAYGPPGVFSGRDRAPATVSERERRARERANDLDVDDPLPGFLKELVAHMRSQQEGIRDLLKLLPESMQHATAMYKNLAERAMGRVGELEARQLETWVTFEELTSAKHIRDLEIARQQGSEQRRNETLALLKSKAPALLDRFFATSDLASFVKSMDPALVGVVLDSGLLNAEQTAILGRAAGLQQKTTAPGSNGKGATAQQGDAVQS